MAWKTVAKLLCLVLTLSAGCASRQNSTQTNGQCPAGLHANIVAIDPVFLEDLQYVRDDIALQSGTDAELLIVAGTAPNAFAWKDKKKEFIAINLGLIKLLDENFDEYAFVIAHEMAHITQGHIDKKKSYNQNVQQAGGVLGLAMEVIGIGLGIPFSGLISSATVNSGAHLAKMGYSRDQEREADEMGLHYMREAGFDPLGAIRFQEKLQQFSSADVAFLSTHPQTEERKENLLKLINKSAVTE